MALTDASVVTPLAEPTVEEFEARFSFLPQARKNVGEARRLLQAKGILHQNGDLIPAGDLPEDMGEGSGQEC